MGPEVGGRGGGAYGFFYLLSDTNVLASTRSHITIQLSDFVPEGDRGGRGGGSAGWFRSNFRPPCQKVFDPVLFLFVAI